MSNNLQKKFLSKAKAMSFEYSLKKNRKERLKILNSNKVKTIQ